MMTGKRRIRPTIEMNSRDHDHRDRVTSPSFQTKTPAWRTYRFRPITTACGIIAITIISRAIGRKDKLNLMMEARQSNITTPTPMLVSATITHTAPSDMIDNNSATALANDSNGNVGDKLGVCPPLEDIVHCRKRGKINSNNRSVATSGTALQCRDCLDELLQNTYAYNATTQPSQSNFPEGHKIYMPIITPPFFGSSILSNILTSSPFVTNMCKYSSWQCESTNILVNAGIISKKMRWDPMETNITKVYETFEEKQVWDNMSAPIRLDKSPPNIAKAKNLMEFFDANGMDYRFIVMMRHPCRKDWKHPQHATHRYSKYLEDIIKHIPEDRRFFVNYDDLITRPGKVLQGLLAWFPLLSSLRIDSSELRSNKKRGRKYVKKKLASNHLSARRLMGVKEGGSLKAFIYSDKCKLMMRSDIGSVDPKVLLNEVMLWEEHFAHDKLTY